MRKLSFLLLCFAWSAGFAKELTPSGYWQQVNEQTKQPQSVIQIWQNQDGSLSGKILGLYPVKGRELAKYCDKCTDHRKNQPIIGMTIINDMQQVDSSLIWSGGEILDPKAGSTYRCKIVLSEDNKTLQVRGYLGIPLLGRSQTWLRLATAELNQVLSKLKTKT